MMSGGSGRRRRVIQLTWTSRRTGGRPTSSNGMTPLVPDGSVCAGRDTTTRDGTTQAKGGRPQSHRWRLLNGSRAVSLTRAGRSGRPREAARRASVLVHADRFSPLRRRRHRRAPSTWRSSPARCALRATRKVVGRRPVPNNDRRRRTTYERMTNPCRHRSCLMNFPWLCERFGGRT
jgi:hypothetical protein